MNVRPVVLAWSGGKDSSLALMRVWEQYDVRLMITMFDEAGERITAQSDRRLTRFETGLAPTDICYVCYTSGTSGR